MQTFHIRGIEFCWMSEHCRVDINPSFDGSSRSPTCRNLTKSAECVRQRSDPSWCCCLDNCFVRYWNSPLACSFAANSQATYEASAPVYGGIRDPKLPQCFQTSLPVPRLLSSYSSYAITQLSRWPEFVTHSVNNDWLIDWLIRKRIVNITIATSLFYKY